MHGPSLSTSKHLSSVEKKPSGCRLLYTFLWLDPLFAVKSVVVKLFLCSHYVGKQTSSAMEHFSHKLQISFSPSMGIKDLAHLFASMLMKTLYLNLMEANILHGES
jgi:hypothetical protein